MGVLTATATSMYMTSKDFRRILRKSVPTGDVHYVKAIFAQIK